MEEYAGVLCSKHLAPHVDSPHYKALVKALLKQALRPLSAADVKELLLQEKAPMETWIALMLEFWRLGLRKQFESLLRDVLQPSIVPVGAWGGGRRRL